MKINYVFYAAQLSTLDFLLIVLSILCFGIILFFITGFIRIKKGCVAIIERMGMYVGTYQHGLRYFMPLVYRRVGMYKMGVTNREVDISRYEKSNVTYEIMDVKLFHYSGHDFDGIVRIAYRDHKDNMDAYLKDAFQKVGVDYITQEIKSIRG
jgi:regulator of protease activity HflC (stomatin/prohibitin superfamily)